MSKMPAKINVNQHFDVSNTNFLSLLTGKVVRPTGIILKGVKILLLESALKIWPFLYFKNVKLLYASVYYRL